MLYFYHKLAIYRKAGIKIHANKLMLKNYLNLDDKNHSIIYFFTMQINKNLISKLEKLSKLKLSEEERDSITGDLNNILQMIEKLDEIDTEGVEPLVYVSGTVNRLRADQVENQVTTKEALKNGPDVESPYFKVPKVIKS